jgi:hypothetical protein
MGPSEFLFRDFVLVMQDDVNMRFGDGLPVPVIAGEEDSEDTGMKSVNYLTDPVWLRLGIEPDEDTHLTHVHDFTDSFAGDPVTPIFKADAGKAVRFRVLKPTGHNRNNVFTLNGHLWSRHPYKVGSSFDGRALPMEITAVNDDSFYHGEQMGMGSMNNFNIVPLHGAGGKNQIPGDYLYRDMTPIHVYNGSWGIFRVN